MFRNSTKPDRRALRARVAAAFRNLANGIDRRTAQDRTWDFFSSSGVPAATGYPSLRAKQPRSSDR